MADNLKLPEVEFRVQVVDHGVDHVDFLDVGLGALWTWASGGRVAGVRGVAAGIDHKAVGSAWNPMVGHCKEGTAQRGPG